MADHELDETKLRRGIIDAFILKVSLPLLADAGGQMAILGTGTLFNIEGRSFIVTADHNLKEDPDDPDSPDIDLTTIAYPSSLQASLSASVGSRRSRPKPAALNTLGPFDLFRPRKPSRLDVAVLELKGDATVKRLHDSWSFLTLANIGTPANCTTFILAGYLFEGATFENGIVGQVVLSLQTNPLHYTPEVEFPDSKFDQFYYLPESLEAGDPPRRVTSLKGLSGASIWSYTDSSDNGGIFPSSAVRVIGIQSSAKMGAWFRGVDWNAVKSILRDKDVGLHTITL
jgi:hypothetical protein